ncbi:hypothetical protein [Frankia sp. AgKG'84/4]|uniref:hypothetical protein n=1 Tax=Frankia sp. AgKG'84/4 TaxID=573490 RepID=UPI002029DC9B|nr:hypothetical protein [Frankia sp. AgKG'84/4]MCL9795572.1 hypothetical protein [Frankia sp. AgKG'84/4]
MRPDAPLEVAGIRALHTGYRARWVTVLLWCPREVTATRAHQRGSNDVEARLTVWDETKVDLDTADSALFDLVLRTNRRSPAEAAERIHQAVTASPDGSPYPHDPVD